MSSLNLSSIHNSPKTHEGGQAKKLSPENQLARSVMSCLLWEKEFYEDGQSIAKRIEELVPKVKPETCAEIAMQAREELYLRHVPLLIARVMAKLPTHKHLVADLLENIVQRADELTEFLAIYWKDGRQPLSAQVKKGLSKAFRKFNEYALAKYNRDGQVKLRDVMILAHAKPKEKEQSALYKRLLDGKLQTPDTWEVALSACKTEEEKKAVWVRLIGEKKLGGLAILRNLRNMLKVSVPDATIRDAIDGSDFRMVLPFRFIAAARYAAQFEPELERALMRKMPNTPKLPGKTIVLVDVSSSMDASMSAKSDMLRADAASGLAMVLREICDEVRVCTFSEGLFFVPPRRGFALRDAIVASQEHHGTYLGATLQKLHQVETYDRIVVITDEQTADRVPDPLPGKIGYMINVASAENGVGYGRWNHIDGFSEAVIDFIAEFEDEQPILMEQLK